jgi:citrate lyase subunit beta/citryl-CoA lyase
MFKKEDKTVGSSMSDIARPRRSALYMPASNAKAVEKARGLDADVIILDLEDAVAPEMKAAARDAAVAAVKAGGFGSARDRHPHQWPRHPLGRR